jgi:chromosome segregation ATPase
MAKHPAPKSRHAVAVKERARTDTGHNGSAKVTGAKNKQAEAIKATEVLQSVAGLNLDTVSGKIAATQVEVQKSLAGLSARLVEELETLRTVEEAITLKREELKQLYDLEAAAVDLDELYAKIDSQRAAWDEEQGRKQRDFAELQSERNKQWARAEEEYQYRVAQEHKKQEDAFEAKIEEREKANRNKQEALEKGWAEREGELKKRETELQELRARVEAIPEQIKKAENAAGIIATNSVKKEYEHKMVIVTKDTELAQKLAAQEVASLKQALDKATAQLGELKAQLEQAHHDVKEISAKALESASGRSAMEALQKVLEKEPSPKQGK